VFTNSIQRSWRVAEALEYGLVGVNEGVISTEVSLIPYSTRLSGNDTLLMSLSMRMHCCRWLLSVVLNSRDSEEKDPNMEWMNI